MPSPYASWVTLSPGESDGTRRLPGERTPGRWARRSAAGATADDSSRRHSISCSGISARNLDRFWYSGRPHQAHYDVPNLYDNLLDVKAAVIRVEEENSELRRTIAQKAEKPPEPQPKEVGNAIYYFVGEKGAYCQPCYDVKHVLPASLHAEAANPKP